MKSTALARDALMPISTFKLFFTRFDEADKGVTVFATTNVSLQDLDASLVRGSRLSSKLKFTMIEGSILKNILKDGLNEKLKIKSTSMLSQEF